MERQSRNKRVVTVMRKGGAWAESLPSYRRKVKAWCGLALKGGQEGALSVVLGDDAFVRDLNHQYRGKDKPTNVLSFAGASEDELGDIVLAYETIASEAMAHGKSFNDHTAHLVVHGCLHLLGHDHETARERRAMEKREIDLLAVLDIANPYLSETKP